MRWVVAGASGFLGRALTADLERDGHQVVRLVRSGSGSGAVGPNESLWDPARGVVDGELLARADVVVNLAGASIGRVPWTKAYRQTILDSRTSTTGLLAQALARLPDPPVYVVQTATGYYRKDQPDDMVEGSPPGDDFLANVVQAWERSAVVAEQAGVRVVRLRCGVVFDQSGGAFRLLVLPFRFGLGGQLGSGRQYMPMVGLPDWLAAVRFLADNADCRGPYNLALPAPPTNAEFTAALGAALHRPTWFTVPAFVLRTVLGEFSTELLGSVRVRPRQLLDAGFTFQASDVDQLVAQTVARQ